MFFLNTHADRRPYDADLQQVLSLSAGRVARERLATWPILSPHPTPAWSLPGLAAALGVAGLTLKDESRRSILGSFKALGGSRVLLINTEGATAPGVYAELVGRSAEAVRGAQQAWLGGHGIE